MRWWRNKSILLLKKEGFILFFTFRRSCCSIAIEAREGENIPFRNFSNPANGLRGEVNDGQHGQASGGPHGRWEGRAREHDENSPWNSSCCREERGRGAYILCHNFNKNEKQKFNKSRRKAIPLAVARSAGAARISFAITSTRMRKQKVQ